MNVRKGFVWDEKKSIQTFAKLNFVQIIHLNSNNKRRTKIQYLYENEGFDWIQCFVVCLFKVVTIVI